jgi:hypothetical protein
LTVPIQVAWDYHLGQTVAWAECVRAGVRRAVLLPRLEAVFSPLQEDPARELRREELEWRLVSPTEADWTRYRELVEKHAAREGVHCVVQRVENVASWAGGRRVAVPHYHIWLYREPAVARRIEALYEEPDPLRRRGLWRWLLAWTAPAVRSEP